MDAGSLMNGGHSGGMVSVRVRAAFHSLRWMKKEASKRLARPRKIEKVSGVQLGIYLGMKKSVLCTKSRICTHTISCNSIGNSGSSEFVLKVNTPSLRPHVSRTNLRHGESLFSFGNASSFCHITCRSGLLAGWHGGFAKRTLNRREKSRVQ